MKALLLFLLALTTVLQARSTDFLVGTGIYDITGPAAQINFMGYAKAEQKAKGIHQRLYARAFIFANRNETIDPDSVVCFVSIDAGMGSDLLNIKVLERLEDLVTNPLCRIENLSISGTHTHSAPAGFLQYALYQITSLGASSEVMDAFVEGTAQALAKAHELVPGTVKIAASYLWDANINRSPTSYLLNPLDERKLYADQGDTDKTMTQIRVDAVAEGKPLGLINWFAVHGTSMNSSNILISGDNKGYASYLMEKSMHHRNPNYVAAFASTNLGDVSPNTAGPRCLDTGLPCDGTTSTCNGRNELCVAFGPGEDMFESTKIIGRKQFIHARSLLEESTERLNGNIRFRHSFIDISNTTVLLTNGTTVRTCPAALGYSFAAGTTDGPGTFNFKQGTNSSNPFWNVVRGFVSAPSQEQIDCQSPKPILLNTGKVKLPYSWDPDVIPISIFQIGSFFILNVPAEFTTMAGRRLRIAVRDTLVDSGINNPKLVIAGLANSYTHYVTTFEEYTGQRYEAASTLYGPHTLSAYIQEFKRITADLVHDRPSESVPPPKDLSNVQISFIPPVVVDTIGWGKHFGSVVTDAFDSYVRGRDTVKVSFRSANPRNNARLMGTFLAIEKLEMNGTWTRRYDDHDWDTRYYWKGGNLGESFAEIHWTIPNDEEQGLYRICHYGTRKTIIWSMETFPYYMPDWITNSLFGSTAVHLIIELLMGAASLSNWLRKGFQYITYSRTKDFEGCSSSFLVRVAEIDSETLQ